ncbi:hypothetical protein CL644_01915 [bacterium]|nr:hypothetical protein [bacterium]
MTTPALKYFIYARKSSEAEDRQVGSIQDQLSALEKVVEYRKLEIVGVFKEAKSAKSPGREQFTKMIECISKGEADGILCWKLNRLTRNPIDGGTLSWMLQQGAIQQIISTDRDYNPTDNVLMMQVEFGMANQFLLDLSKDTKRGLVEKAERGSPPYSAIVGYLNTPNEIKKMKFWRKDAERFELVRKMWDMMLSGKYTPPRIMEIVNNEWGFKMPDRKGLTKQEGISRSAIYKIFTTPAYTGKFEYPKESGKWYEGKYPAMVTEAEYNHVQRLLKKRGRPLAMKRKFAFTGFMKCGECGCGVTAEEKHQMICSECKHKFAYLNTERCKNCDTLI